jgi:hypothetical protein
LKLIERKNHQHIELVSEDRPEVYTGQTAVKGCSIPEPRAFDLTIGELDRVLSLLMGYAKGINGRLNDADWQTLKHHVEDMQAAAGRIKQLYDERWKGLTCDGQPPDGDKPQQDVAEPWDSRTGMKVELLKEIPDYPAGTAGRVVWISGMEVKEPWCDVEVSR